MDVFSSEDQDMYPPLHLAKEIAKSFTKEKIRLDSSQKQALKECTHFAKSCTARDSVWLEG